MPTAPADLLSAAYNDADRTIDLRRRLHRHPEIGLHLPRTQAAVLEAFADGSGPIPTVKLLGVTHIPGSGTPTELLDDCGISAKHIVAAAKALG